MKQPDTEQQAIDAFEEYSLFVDHTQRLSERRQQATQTFLTINTAIFTILAFLFKDLGTTASASVRVPLSLPLFTAGLVVCWIWRAILQQYKKLIGWRYDRLREVEAKLTDSFRMLEREWNDLYKPRRDRPSFNFSNHEQKLPWLFAALYGVYGFGLVLALALGWL